MFSLLTILFVFISLILGFFVIIQQGKGEIGLGGAPSQGSQVIFGGSSGATIFEKVTWILGSVFIIGSLLLVKYQPKENSDSVLKNYKVEKKANNHKDKK